jgi:autotransporter-associated beta strand protein
MVSSLSGFGGTITDMNAAAGTSSLTVNQSTTTSFSGALADGPTRQLALIATGSGMLTLNSANAYSGGTTIDAGTLQLGNANALGSTVAGTVVAPGAVLDLNGQAVGNEAVTIDGTGIAGGGALINSSTAAASLSGPVTLAGDSSIGGSGDLALTGGIGGAFSLTLVGNGNLNSSAARLDSTAPAIVDNKSGGSAFISQGAGGVNLSGTMTNGSNLDLADAGTTTLVGPLNAGTGNVTLSGAVTGAANLLTANTLTLNGGGAVGASGGPLNTEVNSVVLGKNGGDSFLSQDNATPLTLAGVTGGNLTLTAGDTTIALPGLTAAGGGLTVNSLVIDAPIDMGAGSLLANGEVNFNAPGSTLVPTVHTTGSQTYHGAATLEADAFLTSDNNVTFNSTVVSQGMEYNNLTIYAGTVNFHGNVGRLVPDPVGNPNPNLALGTVTIDVSGAINIDPGVEIRVWHENFGIPGGVSQIVPVLHLGPTNPVAATPANPTQTITGYFGLSPNYTEYGQNFTIIVQWDESFRTGTTIAPVITTYAFDPAQPAKSNLNAGGTLNLVVGTDGSIDWSASSLNPGTGSGVINFTITRTYPLSYLASVTQGLRASVTIVTDNSLNFTIANQRITGATADAPVTPVAQARESVQYTVQEAPPIEFQAYSPPAAPVVNSTQQLPFSNTLAGEQPVREEVKKVLRHFKIVKVDPDGSEGTPHALPDDTLEKMPTLLKRFIKSLPNGHYRIYLVEGTEGGEQTTRLIREFYKSGKSLGDPVHEIGPGSIEGQEPETPAGGATPTPGGNGHTDGKTSQGAPVVPLSPGAVKSHAVQVAMLALGALGTAAMRGDWKQRVDQAMEIGAGRSYRRAARLVRRLRSKN